MISVLKKDRRKLEKRIVKKLSKMQMRNYE